jgi:hypothetical protein
MNMPANCLEQYPPRSRLIQRICPAPKRFLQKLVLEHKLTTGLDAGFGSGSPLVPLRRVGLRVTGLDASAEALKRAEATGILDECILGDFLSHDFGDRKFDVVVLSHVIEHFPRDVGLDVLRKAESLASRILYIETPHGFLEQLMKDGNPYQRHLSGWFPHDFQSRGFTVFGSGSKILTGSNGQPRLFPKLFVRLLQRSLQWYFFRRPNRAATIAAIRFTERDGTPRQI